MRLLLSKKFYNFSSRVDLLKNTVPIKSKDRLKKFVPMVPLNILGIRSYNTKVESFNPWFITGFSDAESTFSFSICSRPASSLKWTPTAVFSIGIHSKDVEILERFKSYFEVGNINFETNMPKVCS